MRWRWRRASGQSTSRRFSARVVMRRTRHKRRGISTAISRFLSRDFRERRGCGMAVRPLPFRGGVDREHTITRRRTGGHISRFRDHREMLRESFRDILAYAVLRSVDVERQGLQQREQRQDRRDDRSLLVQQYLDRLHLSLKRLRMGLVELGDSVRSAFLSASTANTVCSASSRWSSLLKWPVKFCKNDCMRSSCAGVPTVFCISLWHLFTAKHIKSDREHSNNAPRGPARIQPPPKCATHPGP